MAASDYYEGQPLSDVLGLYVGWAHNYSTFWSDALPVVHEAGFSTIRVWVYWSETEPTEGDYDWDDLDTAITAAETYGLRVSLVIYHTPPWAQAGTASPQRGPDDTSKLQTFVDALCTRYNGRIYMMEAWNEPNGGSYLEASSGLTLAESYVAILQAVYNGVQSGDSSIIVVGGNSDGRYATAGVRNTATAGSYYSQDDWIDECYTAGASGYFDMWGTHNYPGWPSSRIPEITLGWWAMGRSPWGVVDSIRDAMDTNGDDDKPIGITEVGWINTGTPASDSLYPTRERQRRYTIRHILHAMSRGAEIYQVMFVYDLPDDDNYKGIFSPSQEPYPVATAIGGLAENFGDARYVGELSLGTGNYGYEFFMPATGRRAFAAWTTDGEYLDQDGALSESDTSATVISDGGGSYSVYDIQFDLLGQYTPGSAITLTNDPKFFVADRQLTPAGGASVEMYASLADSGTAPGNNDDPTSTWDDTTENGNDGTLTNIAYTAAEGWNSNPARLTLDGSGYVALPYIGAAADKMFTYEVWIATTSTATMCPISEGGASNARFALRVYDVGGAVRLSIIVRPDSGSDTLRTVIPTGLRDGRPHQLMLIGDGANLQLAYDGAFIGEPLAIPAGTYTLEYTTVGAQKANTTLYYWNGDILCPRIYQRGLDEIEVRNNFLSKYLHAAQLGVVGTGSRVGFGALSSSLGDLGRAQFGSLSSAIGTLTGG